MALPNTLTFGNVVGVLTTATVNLSNPATVPTGTPLQGQITFTASVPRLLATGSTPPATVVLAPVPVVLAPDGSFAVELTATDNTLVNPTYWTWTATFNLVGYTVDPVTFSLPGGTTKDITQLTPTSTTPGVLTVQGAPGAPTNLTIGTVTTLAPGASATATTTGSAPNYTLNLGIPQGNVGATGQVPNARLITAGAGLSGGGDLSADRTLSVIPFTDQGVWAATTAYPYGSIVTYGRQRWITKAAHTSGSTFSGATNWVPLNPLPGGIIARVRRTTNAASATGNTLASSSAVVSLTAVPVTAGRLYRIATSTILFASTGASTTAVAQTGITYTTDGTTPSVSSTILNQGDFQIATGDTTTSGSISTFYTPSATGTLGLLLSYFMPVTGGASSVTMYGSVINPIDLIVEDVGLDPGATGNNSY